MSVPLTQSELRHNCCHVEEGVTLKRSKLIPEEATCGNCVVWRVMGFGGRPNPLVFARFASLAFRTGQALCEAMHPGEVAVRSQLYVDDPAITLSGTPTNMSSTIDDILGWWLVLGLPLAWEKGSWRMG